MAQDYFAILVQPTSQATAEAGTNNNEPMTPLRTKQLIAGNLGIRSDVSTQQFLLSTASFVSDASANGVWMFGGTDSNPNYIGSATEVPNLPGTNGNWSADSGFTPGDIDICTIVGGYDNVSNQTGGGIVAANHCFLKYHADGHSVIWGGSQVLVTAARVSAVGCVDTVISGGLSFACASDSDIGGVRSFAFGSGIVIPTGAQYATAHGSEITVSHNRATVIGDKVSSVGPWSKTFGGQFFSEQDDMRAWTMLDRRRTTDATAGQADTGLYITQTNKVVSGAVRVTIHVQQDGSADGDNSGNYGIATFEAVIGYRYIYPNGYMYNSSTATAVGQDITIEIPAVRNDLSLPTQYVRLLETSYAGNPSGWLVPRLTGLSGTTLNWCIKMEALDTLVS